MEPTIQGLGFSIYGGCIGIMDKRMETTITLKPKP